MAFRGWRLVRADAIDHRSLLRRFILHILEQEGTTYSFFTPPEPISPEEWAYIDSYLG